MIKSASGPKVLNQLFNTNKPANRSNAANGSHYFASIGDYHSLFKSGKATPTEIAKRTLQLIEESNAMAPPLNAFVRTNPGLSLALAEESTARYKAGTPLSILDGVPVGFKDTNLITGWITGSGTNAAAKESAVDEDWVSNLKSLGAIPIGITLSSETANTAFGPNPVPGHGLPINPYAPAHLTGASSAGTAAAVAASLVPLATGSDGAGSVRIPSSWCGNYGLKTTFGRCGIVESQASPLSVQGPHSMSADGMAGGYWAMARKDGERAGVPPPSLLNYSKIDDLSDLRIGIFPKWFEDADPKIVAAARDLLGRLQARGAKVVELELKFSVAMAMAAHRINFGSWIRNSTSPPLPILPLLFPAHPPCPLPTDYRNQSFGVDGVYPKIHDLASRLEFAWADLQLTDSDYFQMLRAKTVITGHLRDAFTKCDAIIFPSTTVPAPLSHPLDAKYGRDDPANEQRFTPFTPIPNLIGLPSVSVPSGYIPAKEGWLPLGTQFWGSWFREDILLRIANAAEDILVKGELPSAPSGKKGTVISWDVLGN